MPTLSFATLSGLVLAAALAAPSAALAVTSRDQVQQPSPSSATPDTAKGAGSLPPPPGHTLVAAYYVAKGTQTYECITNPDGSATWRSRPAALLKPNRARGGGFALHDSRSPQGQAPVPQWTLPDDGSRVVGRVAPGGTFPAPDPTKAIPALRLDVIENARLGRLAPVDVIQRDRVSGGVGPAGTCDPHSSAAVTSRYHARYTFWAPAGTTAISPH